MSRNVIRLCHELTLVVQHADTGKVRYEFRSWRWIVTREALSSIQQGYKIQGKPLLYAFLGSECLLRTFDLVDPGCGADEECSPSIELLLRSVATGKLKYVRQSLPPRLDQAALDQLAQACNDDGHKLMHALIGNICLMMQRYA